METIRSYQESVRRARDESKASLTVTHGLTITRAQWFTFLATCFALHALLRWTVTETVGIDDVDQILRAQIWSWGYGPQPPLYTWLTKIFLGVFGYNALSLLLLKELLMFCLYALVYATARQLTASHVCGLLATALLQANFSIAWENHRELTHTVLASGFSVAVLFTFLRLQPGKWGRYWTFGACCGLGMLSKYNFVIVWLALMLAAISLREMRPLLFCRQMAGALLLMLVICAPHFAWFARHPDLALSTVWKLKMIHHSDWTQMTDGLWRWIQAILTHSGPMLLITGLIFATGAGRLARFAPGQTLVWRTLVCLVVLVTANIIVFRITGLRDRYVQPFFAWLPVLLVAVVRDQINAFHRKALLYVSGLSVVIIALVMPGRVLLTESLKKNEVLNTPFRKFAADLSADAAKADCLVGENITLAGNLRLWFPNKLVLSPEVAPLFPAGPRKVLLIWNGNNSAQPPAKLVGFLHDFVGPKNITQTVTYEELLKYHHQRTMRVGTALVE